MVAKQQTEQLKEQLRGAGLRATASRLAVMRMLRGAPRPLSHADVVEGLKQQPWDRATIYRNLVDLVSAGLARKVELGDRVWRFDGSADSETHDAALHPHFVCTSCGSVECLTDVTITSPRRGIPRALATRDVEVHVRGVCDGCQ